jgi:hypothetical protein
MKRLFPNDASAPPNLAEFLARARSERSEEPSAVAEAPVAGATGMGVGSPCHWATMWGPARIK